MIERLLQKCDLIVTILGVIVLLGLVVFCANIEIKDFDLWLHLTTGRYILQNSDIPLNDVLSHTMDGKSWNNHEWLFQIIIYSVHYLNGIEGLIHLRVFIIVLTFFLLIKIALQNKNMLLPLAVLTLVMLVYRVRTTLRPDIFSILFLSTYIWLLGFHINKKFVIPVMFILQVLWVNMHGFFIVGPAIVLLSFLGEFLKRKARMPFEWNQTARLTDDEYKRTKVLLLITFLACFVNPHFIKGALYPFTVLFSLPGESKIFFKEIGELLAPIRRSDMFTTKYLHYKLLIIISFLSFVFNYRRLDFALLALWSMFLFSSLKAVRNVVFFAIIAFFVIMANSQSIEWPKNFFQVFRRKKLVLLTGIVLKILIMVMTLDYIDQLTLRGYYDFDRYERKSEYGGGVSQRNFPHKAIRFLKINEVKGNFFNDFNSAAFLLFGTHPDIKVFIDGRTELYGPDFFRYYVDIQKGDKEKFKEAVEKYHITGVIHNHLYVPVRKGFISHLYDDEDWVLVYLDYDAVIFLKDVPENQKVISQHRVDLDQWKAPDANLIKVGLTRVSPYRHINRAYAIYNMGNVEAARQEISEAYKLDGGDNKVLKLLSKIAIQEKDYFLGYEYARKAKLVNPTDIHPRYLIAKSLYYQNYTDKAADQCVHILKMRKDQSDTLILLALIQIRKQKFEQAYDLTERGHKIAPDRVKEIIEVGDSFVQHRQWQFALDVYQLALKSGHSKYQKEIEEKIIKSQQSIKKN
ncbi:MAG: hypothetical protein K8S27_14060 [Candidatus Omnitrophica bacterium]|nr:hypothetical protein [Candidatus Omnitrophota bacterium]